MNNLDAVWVSNPGQCNIGLAMGKEVAPQVEASHLKCLPLTLQQHLVYIDISRGASNLVGCHAIGQPQRELLPPQCEGKSPALGDAYDPW